MNGENSGKKNGKVAMVVNEKNEMVEVSNRYIYPFYNLDVGDVFLYNYTPFMKIGHKNIRGVYCDIEINCVSLINGLALHLNNSDLVTLIENPWKDYTAPRIPQGYYKEN